MKTESAIRLLKALADRSRLRIVNSLMDQSRYVEELAKRLDLATSTVSFHLKKLEEVGLIESHKEQYYVMYSLKDTIFDVPFREIVTTTESDRAAEDRRMEQYRRKVIKTFFRYGKLVKIPVQRKKRRIILEEIARKFVLGRRYPEREVNLIIADFHDDFCTIRREFICEKIMDRARGEYWLVGTGLVPVLKDGDSTTEKKIETR